MTTYTAEFIAHVAALADEGRSARQIAENVGITRNAVIGICYRRGIRLHGRRGRSTGIPRNGIAAPPRFVSAVCNTDPETDAVLAQFTPKSWPATTPATNTEDSGPTGTPTGASPK
jgi:hypothetical protein